MRTAFDLTPFRRSSVGFDRLFDLLENGTALLNGETYPPFDLEQEGEDRYRITLAVAGFRPEEIDLTAQQDMLIVTGRKADQSESGRYIHRGIAARSFERRFVLGDHVDVRSAELTDGLLRIELVREVPEEMKPKKIQIGSASEGQQQRLADQQQSANHNEREAVAA